MSIAVLLLFTTAWSILDTKTHHIKKMAQYALHWYLCTCGLLMLVYIRNLGSGMEGFWLILTFFLMIWGNDIFAYFGGRTFGKRPLAPKISPKKTWEGFWSGFMGAAAGFFIVLSDRLSISAATLVSPSCCAADQHLWPFGRHLRQQPETPCQVKDSSALLPGHGGLFDRFDSMILTAPFIFFLFYYLIEAGF
jgi:phosphatidate cytidylyltransferase